ncbi:MAG: SRPBCC domain-containing protein [Psychromonas sp.]|nr:SRPBCC domain-containing protein [Psychromonas sp.]
MKFSDSVIISCSPIQVWEVLTQFEQYVNWNPFIVNINGSVQQGEDLLMTMKLGRRTVDTKVTVTEVKPFLVLEWEGSIFSSALLKRLFSVRRTFSIEQIADQQVRFKNQEVFIGLIGNVIAFLLQKHISKRYGQYNHAIKKWCEARTNKELKSE